MICLFQFTACVQKWSSSTEERQFADRSLIVFWLMILWGWAGSPWRGIYMARYLVAVASLGERGRTAPGDTIQGMTPEWNSVAELRKNMEKRRRKVGVVNVKIRQLKEGCDYLHNIIEQKEEVQYERLVAVLCFSSTITSTTPPIRRPAVRAAPNTDTTMINAFDSPSVFSANKYHA